MNLLDNQKLAVELAKCLIQKDDVRLTVNNGGDIRFIIDGVELDFTEIAHEFLIRLEQLDQL